MTIFDLVDPCIKNSNFVKGNILDLKSIKKAASDSNVIIHMVGLADAGIAQNDPMKSFNLNIVALNNILEVCRENKKKIIFPSSAAVYGRVEELPIKESLPMSPTNIYSWHKFICEKMIKSYQANYGIQYVILRLFNVYGKNNKGVINFFIDKAKLGEEIITFGPYQYRDFVYAGDVVDAIFNSVLYEKAVNRCVNIGSGRGTQIRELLEILQEIFPEMTYKEEKSEFTMYDSIADITLAKILLDFKPNKSTDFMKKIIKEEMI